MERGETNYLMFAIMAYTDEYIKLCSVFYTNIVYWEILCFFYETKYNTNHTVSTKDIIMINN